MIVIGIDPHKRMHTAVAVKRATGELVAERTVQAREHGHGELVLWARSLAHERVWALEDCRHVAGPSSASCSPVASACCGCRPS